MGDVKKVAKRGRDFALQLGPLGEKGSIGDKIKKGIEKPLKTGASAQRREAGREIESQKQKEKLKLLETEDEIARKRALAGSKTAGRRSLISSSPSGLATTLGGG